MVIEICIEHKERQIFCKTFNSNDGMPFAQFRADFNENFAQKHPKISFDDMDIRETWRRVDLARPPSGAKAEPRRNNSGRSI